VSALPLSKETRASLERALESWDEIPQYSAGQLNADVFRALGIETETGLAHWLLAADDAIRAAVEQERGRILKAVRQMFADVEADATGEPYNSGHQHGEEAALHEVIAMLQKTDDTIAALRQEQG
jgi:hypothetical protein